MLTKTLSAVPPSTHVLLADATGLTNKASDIGKAILAATVVLALVAAFFTQAQRRWVTVGTILLIGAFTFMIVGSPAATLTQLGNFIKTNVWDQILG
ncbi:hypothetical protein BIV57_08140 [Mangrovactinospora gilvigrisea]|uniref:Uncharacterized protein n=1 Tax=Mangrovactinospora gilvigrisea TaxID=1428644 RepID=A0A1J7C8Y7_9ACTN|nr:hypothetical protein [Mangrovactinospora gilvigrisea]OIV37996.1 hypothetical protein BIV57_08140 [Mangrovactinospora gilvigrisea]